ncbi:MAG: MFS transporter [Gammaproteobacteria bacterium]|nr:MFS transporter [Gammaproteobacteria bacterium]
MKDNNTSLSKKSFFGAAIGTMIEYYDYSLFVMFLPIFSPIFFTANTAYQALSKMFLLMTIPVIARPLGALFFGYYGDFIGRRKALLLSMYGIATATFCIGLIPSAEHIGLWAAILIVAAKTIQVFCYGGEYNGAGIYVVEHAKNKQEGLIGSLLSTATTFGSLLASLAGVLLTVKYMPTWSWRVGFMLGGLVGLFGVFYRKKMLEVPAFSSADPKKHSLLNLLKEHPREILLGIFIGGLSTIPATTVMGFINPVLMSKGFFNSHELMLIHTLLNIVSIVILIIVGFVSNKISPAKIMRFGALLYVLLTYPLLQIIDLNHLAFTIPALAGLLVLSGIFFAPSNAFLKTLFSMPYRYRGISLSFCLGMGFFGGLTPVVDNYLYQATGRFSAISLWLISVSFITYWAFYLIKDKTTIQFKEALAKY